MEEEELVVVNDGGGADSGNNNNNNKGGRRSVQLNRIKLRELADEILVEEAKTMKERETNNNNNNNNSFIEWDTEGWHYSGEGYEGSEIERKERVALYLLALDAINFCFWPLPNDCDDNGNGNRINLLEYEHMAVALKRMAEADHVDKDENDSKGYVFSPSNLATTTPESMRNLFQTASESCSLDLETHPIPSIAKRASLWREVGEGLLRHYHGSASDLLGSCHKDASKLVELVAVAFPGFQDEMRIPPTEPSPSQEQQQEQQRIVFLKRAQIFVGDINAALRLNLEGMNSLTTFADYRVPQILRHRGILKYSQGLATKVDLGIELENGCTDEASIRASTVVAVEELVKLLNEGKSDHDGGASVDRFTDVTVDWYLWQVGERMNQEGIMKPFHKVRTHFY